MAAGYGVGAEELVGARLDIDEGIAGYVLEQGQVFVSATPSRDLLVADSGEERKGNAGSVVAVPLTVNEQTVGVLELVKEGPDEAFDDRRVID